MPRHGHSQVVYPAFLRRSRSAVSAEAYLLAFPVAQRKGSFSALVYLHRYTSDTVPRLLNGYLRQYAEKLRNRRENLLTVSRGADISAGEKNRAIREAERLEKIGAELTAYERDVIYPLTAQPLALDLDDIGQLQPLWCSVGPGEGTNGQSRRER